MQSDILKPLFFFSIVSVFLPLANGVTLRFLLEVATVQLSSWCVGSLSLSLACDISILSFFFLRV